MMPPLDPRTRVTMPVAPLASASQSTRTSSPRQRQASARFSEDLYVGPAAPQRQTSLRGRASAVAHSVVSNVRDALRPLRMVGRTQSPVPSLRRLSTPEGGLSPSALRAWAKAAHISRAEKKERARAALLIAAALQQPEAAKNLDLSEFEQITRLPPGLAVRGDLNLTGWSKLEELSGDLQVGGHLRLTHCANLEALPRGLRVGGSLFMQDCTALSQLPANFVVPGDFNLSRCTALEHLPEGLWVGKSLNLSDCSALKSLPAGFVVEGTLNLCNCRQLTQLPEHLRIQGNLYLVGCTQLRNLPTGLSVGGHLQLTDCAALRELPEGLRVGGNLNLVSCAGLTHLPGDIAHWGPLADGSTRTICLTGSGISETIREQMQSVCQGGIHFI